MDCITVNPDHKTWRQWNQSELETAFATQRQNFIDDVGEDAFQNFGHEFPQIGVNLGPRAGVRDARGGRWGQAGQGAHTVQAATAFGASASNQAAPARAVAKPAPAPPRAPPPKAQAPAHEAHTQATSDQVDNQAAHLLLMNYQIDNQAHLIRDTHIRVENQAGQLRAMTGQIDDQAGQLRRLREMQEEETHAHDEQFNVLTIRVRDQAERISDLAGPMENQLRNMAATIDNQVAQLHAMNSRVESQSELIHTMNSQVEDAFHDMEKRIHELEESLEKKNAEINEKIVDMQMTLENVGAGVHTALGPTGRMGHDMADAMQRIHNAELAVEQHGRFLTYLRGLLTRYCGLACAPHP